MIQGNILRLLTFIFITIAIIIAGCVDNKINTDKEIKTVSPNKIYEWNESLFAIVNKYTENVKDYESGKIDDIAFGDLSIKRVDELENLNTEINTTRLTQQPNSSIESALIDLQKATLYTALYINYVVLYIHTDDLSEYEAQKITEKNAKISYNNFKQKLLEAGYKYPTTSLDLPSVTEKYISIGTGVVESVRIGYDKPSKENIFLIVTLNIYNRGYNKFNVNPYLFKLEVDNVLYSFDPLTTYSLNSGTYRRVGSQRSEKSNYGSLKDVDLLNGGTIEGDLVFEVPKGYQNYKIIYDGYRKYNIK